LSGFINIARGYSSGSMKTATAVQPQQAGDDACFG
jgi:hypothetical protein